MLRQNTIEEIKNFLTVARENLVPVLILTNENLEDVKAELGQLAKGVYDEEAGINNFVFVMQKGELLDWRIGRRKDYRSVGVWKCLCLCFENMVPR